MYNIHAKSLQSCLTLCDPMDCSQPDSSVFRIHQVRILEWVAIWYTRGSSQPKDRTHVSCVSCIGRQILYHCTTRKSRLMQNSISLKQLSVSSSCLVLFDFPLLQLRISFLTLLFVFSLSLSLGSVQLVGNV